MTPLGRVLWSADRGSNLTVEARAERLEDMMSRVLDLIDEMQAHGEHQLVAVQVGATRSPDQLNIHSQG